MAPREIAKVSIVGFHSLVREGISRTLSESEFRNNNFYSCAEDAINELAGEEAAIAIVDLKSVDDPFRPLSLLQANCRSLRVVLMVEDFDFKQMVAAFQRGAYAYLLKEIGSLALIDSLRLVARGEKVLPAALLQHLPDTEMISDKKADMQVQLSELLSGREIDTLRCLVMGYPNKVIAYRLDISEATVKVHVKAILRKLSVQNRTQAAIWAVNQGLVIQSSDFREYAAEIPAELTAVSALSDYARPVTELAHVRSY